MARSTKAIARRRKVAAFTIEPTFGSFGERWMRSFASFMPRTGTGSTYLDVGATEIQSELTFLMW